LNDDCAVLAAAGVPPTALVSAFVDASDGGAVKVGSLQQFVDAEGDCEERGYSSFPVQEVHKIAVLVSRHQEIRPLVAASLSSSLLLLSADVLPTACKGVDACSGSVRVCATLLWY
jgi:hypothetical protein